MWGKDFFKSGTWDSLLNWCLFFFILQSVSPCGGDFTLKMETLVVSKSCLDLHECFVNSIFQEIMFLYYLSLIDLCLSSLSGFQ